MNNNNVDDTALSPEDERLFDERLPWYVNGTLDGKAHEWMESKLAASPAAVRRLAQERALSRSVPGMLAPAAKEVGLDRLLARVRADGLSTSAPPAGWRSAVRALQQWLALPRVATAMALMALVQAGFIGWLVPTTGRDSPGEARSVAVTEVRTLRVTFVPSASEAQVRAALLKAGARIVGGPTQLGEYWLASGMVSLEEIKESLRMSGLVASMDIDTSGPRGH